MRWVIVTLVIVIFVLPGMSRDIEDNVDSQERTITCKPIAGDAQTQTFTIICQLQN